MSIISLDLRLFFYKAMNVGGNQKQLLWGCFAKHRVLKNFAKFTGKTLVPEALF